MPRKRQLVDLQTLEQIARDYYLNLRTQKEIASKHNVSQSKVAHLLDAARTKGIVWHDIDADFALAGVLDEKLSRRLREAFGLRECLVVDPSDDSVDDDAKSDKLHTIIANSSGPRIKSWIQSRDHVVVGGGRAPVAVARFVRRSPASRNEIRISPLSGRIWTGAWQADGADNLQRPLDADDAARLLALAYEHERGTRFSQIGHPLYARTAGLARGIVDEECVFSRGGGWKTEWGLHPPSRALVGVGVFHPDSGHRISELLKKIAASPDMKVAQHLKDAAGELKVAIEFAEANSLPCFGDVANRLFPALPLPHELKQDLMPSPTVFQKLSKLLETLNDRAVVMEWVHLRRIPSVWALAGGGIKVHVIWTLLLSKHLEPSRNESVINEFSTDAKTAQSLLKAWDDFRKSSAAVQQWYETICAKLFLAR